MKKQILVYYTSWHNELNEHKVFQGRKTSMPQFLLKPSKKPHTSPIYLSSQLNYVFEM